jgi:hypothetical protein
MELDHRITIWAVGNISQTWEHQGQYTVLLPELLEASSVITALLTELLKSWSYVTVLLCEMSGILKTDRPGAQPYFWAVL